MKRAFVGLSTPLGYDYLNPIQERTEDQRDIPNPVLENTTGLLLCYDELWFPDRDFCPLDMQQLPYVKFIADFPELVERAQVAQEQFREIAYDEGGPALDTSESYTQKIVDLKKAVPFELGIDNHSRGGNIFGMGNAGDPQRFVEDMGIAAAMDMDLDLIVSSRLRPRGDRSEATTLLGSKPWKHHAAELITGVQTTGWLGKEGAYHESIEQLRVHPRVREFRDFLANVDEPSADALKLTKTVNELADKHARDVMEKYIKGRGRVYTIGTSGLGGVGNLIHPGLGNLLQMALGTASWMKDRSQGKKVSWSLFVLDSRRMHSNQ